MIINIFQKAEISMQKMSFIYEGVYSFIPTPSNRRAYARRKEERKQ